MGLGEVLKKVGGNCTIQPGEKTQELHSKKISRECMVK